MNNIRLSSLTDLLFSELIVPYPNVTMKAIMPLCSHDSALDLERFFLCNILPGIQTL